MRSLLQNSIEKMGAFHIETATNGVEALAIIRNNPIDLMIIDNHMPKIDGLDVIREIKYDASAKNISIMFMTFRATKDIVLQIRAEKLKIDYFLAETFDLNKVTECVSEIFTRVRRNRKDGQPAPNDQKDKREAVRYSQPILRVSTFLGVVATINWSLSGLLLSHAGENRFIRASVIPAKIAAEKKRRYIEAKLYVVIDDPHRAVAAMKFIDVEPPLLDYLKSLVS